MRIGVLAFVSVIFGAFGLSTIGAVPACAPPDEAATDDDDETEAEDNYTLEGKCDGLPRAKLTTPKGVCVGIAASGFVWPRGIAELANGDLVMAGMGGWVRNVGTVWRLRREANGTFEKTLLLDGIDEPSGVVVGPDGLPYVGTRGGGPGGSGGIFRFDPANPRATMRWVIRDLPSEGRHPLKAMVFDKREPWVLYVNDGSATDVCEAEGHAMPCREAEGPLARGTIRKYKLDGPDHVESGFETIAWGLRNSMALAVHPTSNVLLQGENSRDEISRQAPELAGRDVELPHEELNVIVPGAHYGWPYCYDNGANNPEYRQADCGNYKSPALLLPGHAAPLGMKYYFGNSFPSAYRGNLILGYHGYRAYGHRLVMVPVDATGIPNGEPKDIIRGWDENTATNTPLGAPVDVLVAKDGSIFVTEDKNGDVLRVFYDKTKGHGRPLTPKPIDTTPLPGDQARCAALLGRSDLFSRIEREIIDTRCVGCHGVGPGFPGKLALLKCDDVGNAKRLLAARPNAPALVAPNDVSSELVLRLEGRGFPQMPAGGIRSAELDLVKQWIASGAPVPANDEGVVLPADRSQPCPQGNGEYCGGNGIRGASNTLYHCESGVVTVVKACEGRCRAAPPGQIDKCVP
jgi:glucose/arabinose dehydrogenase